MAKQPLEGIYGPYNIGRGATTLSDVWHAAVEARAVNPEDIYIQLNISRAKGGSFTATSIIFADVEDEYITTKRVTEGFSKAQAAQFISRFEGFYKPEPVKAFPSPGEVEGGPG